MNAYLTFTRILNNEIHFIGLENPINANEIKNQQLLSGQPVLCVIENKKLLSLYLVRNDGFINQIFGEIDNLFQLNTIKDISLINLLKYNSFKFYLANIFQILSFDEMNNFYQLMTELENKIFYNFLHTEIIDFKKLIIREINKSNWTQEYKKRFIEKLNKTRIISKKLLNKKIDLDLSGYRIYINTRI